MRGTAISQEEAQIEYSSRSCAPRTAGALDRPETGRWRSDRCRPWSISRGSLGVFRPAPWPGRIGPVCPVIELGIPECDVEGAVPHELFDDLQRSPRVEELGGKRMPQRVGRIRLGDPARVSDTVSSDGECRAERGIPPLRVRRLGNTERPPTAWSPCHCRRALPRLGR